MDIVKLSGDEAFIAIHAALRDDIAKAAHALADNQWQLPSSLTLMRFEVGGIAYGLVAIEPVEKES